MTRRMIRVAACVPAAIVLAWECGCGSGEGDGRCIAIGDRPWQDNIQFTMSDPGCPVRVAYQQQPKPVAATFLAFADRLYSDRVIMHFLDAAYVTIMWLEPRWVDDPNPAYSRIDVNTTYLAGTWRTGDPVTDRDTLELETQLYLPGGITYARAGARLPYVFDVYASVAAPPSVHVGEWATLTVAAENAYAPSYAWRRNGDLIGETGSQHSVFGSYVTTYNYNITVRDFDGDSTVVGHVLQVIPYSATVNGYTEVQPYATCTWRAVTNLPSPPYAYEWRVDNVLQSTDESFAYVVPGSPFSIDVRITNSVGQFAFGLLDVSVNQWAQECLDM